MNEIKKLYNWFIQEWFIVFLFGAFFGIIFGDISLMGWFVAGALIKKKIND